MRYAGHMASAHISLFIYMLLMRFSVSAMLIYMVYITGLLSILLFSVNRETYSKYLTKIIIMLVGLTTFIPSIQLSMNIYRWIPLVVQITGAHRVKNEEGVVDVIVSFTLMYYLLNMFYEVIKL